jgi:hypothetical protein
MPRRWRRKFTALFDNVLESGLGDAQLATLVRLQALLHRAWRTDPERFSGWTDGDAEKTLTLNELREVTGVATPHKSRAKLLALAGCDPYGTGALEVAVCASPGFVTARSERAPGSHADAQSVRIRWPKFSEVLNLRRPDWRSPGGAARPYEGRSTKYEVRGDALVPLGTALPEPLARSERGAPPCGRRVVEGSPPTDSPGWNLPPDAPRLSEMTDEERADARRRTAEMRRKLGSCPKGP